MRRDDESTLAGSGFITMNRIILLIVFLIGALAGGYITNKFIDQNAISSASADTNSLIQANKLLDTRNDKLAKCLMGNGIQPDTCS